MLNAKSITLATCLLSASSAFAQQAETQDTDIKAELKATITDSCTRLGQGFQRATTQASIVVTAVEVCSYTKDCSKEKIDKLFAQFARLLMLQEDYLADAKELNATGEGLGLSYSKLQQCNPSTLEKQMTSADELETALGLLDDMISEEKDKVLGPNI